MTGCQHADELAGDDDFYEAAIEAADEADANARDDEMERRADLARDRDRDDPD